MKHMKHIAQANAIGRDSWELNNFQQLRKNASAASQVEALKRDQKWQEDHMGDVSGRIDALVWDIEKGADR